MRVSGLLKEWLFLLVRGGVMCGYFTAGQRSHNLKPCRMAVSDVLTKNEDMLRLINVEILKYGLL